MTPVPADEARAHLNRLRRYVSDACIAELSGLACSTIKAIATGAREHITSQTNATILATGWDLQVVPDEYLVPAFCVQRRLEALACLGWGSHELAPHIGVTPATLRRLRTARRVPAGMAKRISSTYDGLSMSIGTNDDARRAAVLAGYRPPLMWDEDGIDLHSDDQKPVRTNIAPLAADQIRAHLRPRAQTTRTGERCDVDLLRRLKLHGLSDQCIASQLGVTLRTVQRTRARHRIPATTASMEVAS